MFGLENKGHRFIGIDFGTSAIKVVELSYKDQKPYLENYGWFDLSGIFQRSDDKRQRSYDEKFKLALHNLLKKIKPDGDHAYISMPGFSGLVVLIEFPGMKKDEIDKAIEFEAHKYIPASVDEVSISWEIVNRKESSEDGHVDIKKKLDVLLVAAPKKEVAKYSALLEGTNLKMKAIELETFSLARALSGGEAGNHIIIDIGSRTTNIILVENGSVVISRSIDVGGTDITATIAEALNVSKQRAESFKKEGKDFINGKESVIVIPALDLLAGEAKRILAAYKEKNKSSTIEKIILSGGSSGLVGIDKYFNSILNLEIVRSDPWKNITYDKRLESRIKKIGPSFSVALGLAIRGIEDLLPKGK